MEQIRIRNIEGDMPLDRWDGEQFIHATGREYWDEFPGCWRTEYEDDDTVDLPTTE